VSSIYSYVYLFHTGATGLANLSAENSVCAGTPISWVVNGIDKNYPGSEYTIHYGDAAPSSITTVTHAQLLQNDTFTHTYTVATCISPYRNITSGNYYNEVFFYLYNKGIKVGPTLYCSDYQKNGNGVQRFVNISIPPTANFTTSAICTGSNLVATSTTTAGQYGYGGTCQNSVTYTWYYKRPSGTDFIAVTTSSWIVGNVLTIPSSLIAGEAGCWSIKLEAANLDGCTTASTMEKTVSVTSFAVPKFGINQNGVPVSTICRQESVNLFDSSNAAAIACATPAPTYSWSISPGTGFVYTTGSASSQNPTIQFNTPGTYTITQSITNTCGTRTANKTIVVLGDPTVSIAALNTFCINSPVDTTIDFSASPFNPTYSAFPAQPLTYSWTVGGSGVVASDYVFVTSGTSAFPKIRFLSAKDYTVTVNITGCATSAAASITIRIRQNPTVSLAINPTDLSFCRGETPLMTATATPGTSPTLSYAWYNNGSAISGATGTTYTVPATIAAGTYIYKVQVTDALSCSAKDSLTLTVKPVPALSSTLTPSAICSNTTFAYTATSTVVGTGFSWSRPAIAGINSGVAGSGTGNVSETLTNSTTAPIVVTYVYTLTVNGCTNTQNVTVTVNPRAVLTSTLAPAAICTGVTFSYTPTTATTGSTFVWSRAAMAGINGGVAGSGTNSISETLTNSTTAPITVTYVYTLTANGCANSQNVTVVVNPRPQLTTTTIAAICTGATVNYTPVSATSGTTFSWTRASIASITPATASGTDGISEVLNNASTAPITVTYVYTLAANGCSNTQNVTVVVNPRPLLTSALTPAAVCSGATFSYTASSATVGTTFSWSRAAVTGISNTAATGTTSISEILNNTTTDPIVVTYVYTLTANGCTNTQNVTVTINPGPQLSSVTTAPAICSGTLFSYTPSSATAGASFSWTRAIVAGITPATTGSGSGNVSETLTNTSTAPLTVTYVYTIAANGCSRTQNVSVIVNPKPVLSSSLATSVCNNVLFTYTPTSATTGTTFSWSRAVVAGISNDVATGTSGISETLVNTTTAPVAVTYVYTLTANGCSNTQNVVVTVNPTPLLTSTQTPAAVCSASPFTYTATSATSGTTFTWTRAVVAGISNTAGSGSGASVNETLTNTTANPINVTYVFVLTANGCSNSQSVVVTINPRATLSSGLSATAICSGATFAYTPASATVGIAFSWTRAAITGITTATSSGTDGISETLTSSLTAPVTVTYAYNLTANGCSNPQNVTVVVNPKPVLTSSLSPAVCNNVLFSYTATSATSGTTFSWSRAAVTGISNAAATGTTSISETLLNTTTDPVIVSYVYTLTANGCSNTQNVSVTVNPTPALSSTLLPAAICSATAFTYSATSATAGTTFSWSRAVVTGITPATGSGANASVNETLTNGTTAPITITYVFTLSANGCTRTQNVPLVINPRPVLSSSLTPAAICNGATFSYTPASATTGTVFTWSRPAVGGISEASASGTGNISETLTNTTTAPVTVTYSVTLTANNCVNTQTVSVIVNPTPSLSSTLTPAAVCSAAAFTYTAASATAGTSYSWTRAAVAGITPATGSGSTATVNETLTNGTANPIQVTYVFTLTASGCANTQSVTVTINPKASLSSVLSAPSICSGALFAYTPISATSGTTFNWTRAVVAGITPGTAGSGTDGISELLTNTTTAPVTVTYVYTLLANGCTNTQSVTVVVNPKPLLNSPTAPVVCSNALFAYTATSATTGTTFSWSRADVTGIANAAATGTGNISETLVNTTTAPIVVTYVYTLAANGCSSTQNVNVTVNPRAVLTSTLTPSAICSGTAFTYTATSATTGTTYSWSRAAVAGISNTAATGATASINETLTNTTTAPINVTYVFTLTANGCSNPQSVVVIVNPKPVLTSGTTITAICTGATASYTPTSATTGVTFSWSRAAVSNISNVAATGTDGISETLINTGTAPVTVTYVYTLTANGCSNTQNVTVVVNPRPVLTSSLAPASICSATAFSYTASSATTGTVFSWSRAAVTGISNTAATGASASINETLTNTTADPIDVVYVYTLTANGCSNTQSVTVTVKPIPSLTSALTGAICSANLYAYTPTSATAGVTFSWSRALVTNITPATGSGTGAISETLVNNTTASINVTYVFTLAAGGCSRTQSLVVAVNPSPSLSSTLTPAAICSGATFNYTATSATAGTAFSWSRADVVGISNIAATGTGNISEALINTTTAPIVVTYVYTLAANGCSRTQNVVVTVNPTPTADAVVNKIFCTAVPTGAIAFSGTVSGTTFNWTNNTTAIGLAASGTGTISFTTANATTAPLTGTITVTPTANACPGAPITFTITVNPKPVLSSAATIAAICTGATVNYTPASATTGVAFTWSRAAVAGITEGAATGTDAVSETLTNTTTAPITVTYIYTLAANGCANTQNVTVVVNPKPVLTSTLTPASVCSATAFAYTATSATTGTTYSWSRAAVLASQMLLAVDLLLQ
jgi:hypothetical protein